MIIIRASLGSEIMSEKRKPNDLFDAPNRLQIAWLGVFGLFLGAGFFV